MPDRKNKIIFIELHNHGHVQPSQSHNEGNDLVALKEIKSRGEIEIETGSGK
ncbi:MAG: hypothetical protein ACFFCS_26635 [Candidatus Hodarchaeota archaeon]